jgi:hypothetical protein
MTSRHHVPRWSAALGIAALASFPVASAGAAVVPAAAPAAVAGCVRGDLSGDGAADLAVGAPGEDIGSARNAGAVNVLLGRGDGTFGGGRYLTQESVGQVSGAGDMFGTAVAVADVTYDGCTDLVIGVPGENASAGIVVVLRGSASGIGGRPIVLREGYAGATGAAEAGDRFGAALSASGGLLLVGAPGEDVGTIPEAGAVAVFQSAPLTTRGSYQLWQGKSGSVGGVAEAGDRFGAALAGSTLIGAPGEDVGDAVDAGSVYAYLDGKYQQITQDSNGMPDSVEAGDRFGEAVAIAYPTCYHDMVEANLTLGVWLVGAPGEDVGVRADVGYVAYPSGGYSSAHNGTEGVGPWTSMPVPQQAGARSGAALAGSSTEVVVGSPGRTVSGAARAGEVAAYAISGSCGTDWDFRWSAATGPRGTPFPGVPETGDQFGSRLAAVAGSPEVFVVGAPGEDLGAWADAGAVTVVDVVSRASQELSQNTTGVPGAAEPGDWFGSVAALF